MVEKRPKKKLFEHWYQQSHSGAAGPTLHLHCLAPSFTFKHIHVFSIGKCSNIKDNLKIKKRCNFPEKKKKSNRDFNISFSVTDRTKWKEITKDEKKENQRKPQHY